MRWAIASIGITGLAAAGMFAALSGASRNSPPMPPTPGGITIVYPTVRPSGLTSKARGSLLQVRFLFDRASGVLSSRPPILLPPRAGAVKAGRVLRGHRKAWP